jgi:hypothetical protein
MTDIKIKTALIDEKQSEIDYANLLNKRALIDEKKSEIDYTNLLNESALIDEKQSKIDYVNLLNESALQAPMTYEYEKVLDPFIIQGKMRYVENLYEKDLNETIVDERSQSTNTSKQ